MADDIGPVLDYRELWEVVRERLRDEIIAGDLRPGSRLTETDLAARFGVSRGPIRTALRDLERVGLASTSSRRGVEVASFSARDVEELHDLHEMVERQGIILGVDSQTDASRDGLISALERLDAAENAGDARAAVEADLDFHRRLAKLSKNSRMMHTWEMHADQVRVVIAAVQRADHRVASRNGDHPLIVDGLMAGNLELALRAHGRHFDDSRRVMVELIEAERSDERSGATADLRLLRLPQET